MSHPNLSPEINKNIEQSEKDGGVFLKDIKIGESVKLKTRNTLYTLLRKEEKNYFLSGHDRYCPFPVEATILGSTWGGSMIKIGFLGLGMCMEFSTYLGGASDKIITTTPIESITFGE